MAWLSVIQDPRGEGVKQPSPLLPQKGDGLTGREGLLHLKGSRISVLGQNIRSLWRKMIHLEATWREREALRGQAKHTLQMHLGDYFLQPGPTLNCPLGKNSSVD